MVTFAMRQRISRASRLIEINIPGNKSIEGKPPVMMLVSGARSTPTTAAAAVVDTNFRTYPGTWYSPSPYSSPCLRQGTTTAPLVTGDACMPWFGIRRVVLRGAPTLQSDG